MTYFIGFVVGVVLTIVAKHFCPHSGFHCKDTKSDDCCEPGDDCCSDDCCKNEEEKETEEKK